MSGRGRFGSANRLRPTCLVGRRVADRGVEVCFRVCARSIGRRSTRRRGCPSSMLHSFGHSRPRPGRAALKSVHRRARRARRERRGIRIAGRLPMSGHGRQTRLTTGAGEHAGPAEPSVDRSSVSSSSGGYRAEAAIGRGGGVGRAAGSHGFERPRPLDHSIPFVLSALGALGALGGENRH